MKNRSPPSGKSAVDKLLDVRNWRLDDLSLEERRQCLDNRPHRHRELLHPLRRLRRCAHADLDGERRFRAQHLVGDVGYAEFLYQLRFLAAEHQKRFVALEILLKAQNLGDDRLEPRLRDHGQVELAHRDSAVRYQRQELWPKVGEGVNRGRRHIVGVFEPPLLHRRSDMPCPTITLSN
jgi:hypothetical protein